MHVSNFQHFLYIDKIPRRFINGRVTCWTVARLPCAPVVWSSSCVSTGIACMPCSTLAHSSWHPAAHSNCRTQWQVTQLADCASCAGALLDHSLVTALLGNMAFQASPELVVVAFPAIHYIRLNNNSDALISGIRHCTTSCPPVLGSIETYQLSSMR